MLRPKRAAPKWASPCAATSPRHSAQQHRHKEQRWRARSRRSRGQTSRPGSQASGLTSNRRDPSDKLPRSPVRRHRECEHGARPKSAKDNELREYRYRGRSVASLYNNVRPHASFRAIVFNRWTLVMIEGLPGCRSASTSSPGDGSPNELSHGSADAVDAPIIGRQPPRHQPPGRPSPSSACLPGRL